MPRKFLGQRIEPDVDFVRPSSVTLTADDLRQIPSFLSDSIEDGQDSFKGKISRKFGGTIRLKKRLESVPELFLHDLRKKPTRSRTKKRATSKRLERPKDILPTVKEVDSKPLFTDDELNKIFVSKPILMPVMVRPETRTLTKHANGSISSSEQLFDEIISAYGGGHSRPVPKLLETEIDCVLAHLSREHVSKKPVTAAFPRVFDADSFQPVSPVLDPVSPVMSAGISSPEYTGGSSTDHWSSGDEFSEISGSGGDDFVTATNSLRSSRRSSPSPEIIFTEHQIQPVKLRMTQLTPSRLFVRDDQSLLSESRHDEEDVEELEGPSAFQLLQEKIESVALDSASSSIYSENRVE